MLCSSCQQKSTLQVPGKCKNCSSPTTHFAYGLCPPCGTKLDQCVWCETPLNATVSAIPTSSVYVTKVREASDNGKTFKSLHPGEEIHVEMDEDQYSGKEWDVRKPLDSMFRLKSKGPFVQDPNNGQYGTRTFVFEVVYSGKGDLDFHEVQRIWSWWGSSGSTTQPVPGGKQFKSTFDVK